MNWHLCVDSAEKHALRLCYGSMNSGTGKGCGDGYSDLEGGGFSGPYDSGGDGLGKYGIGFGSGTGEGNLRLRGGLFSGNCSGPKEWF